MGIVRETTLEVEINIKSLGGSRLDEKMNYLDDYIQKLKKIQKKNPNMRLHIRVVD